MACTCRSEPTLLHKQTLQMSSLDHSLLTILTRVSGYSEVISLKTASKDSESYASLSCTFLHPCSLFTAAKASF